MSTMKVNDRALARTFVDRFQGRAASADDHQVREIARRVVKEVTHDLVENKAPSLSTWQSGVRDNSYPYLFRDITDTIGSKVPVEMRLVNYDYSKKFLDWFGSAGAALDYSGDTLVVIWPVLQEDGSVRKLQSENLQELFHEMVHVLDDLDVDEEPPPFLSGDYYNSPREFRAYFLMGAEKLEEHIRTRVESYASVYRSMQEKLGPERAWYFTVQNAVGWGDEEAFLNVAYKEFPPKWVHYLNAENKSLLEQKLLDLRRYLLKKYKGTMQSVPKTASHSLTKKDSVQYKRVSKRAVQKFLEASGEDYLYHVTLLRNLDSIARRGLVAGQSQNWPGYSSHARGRVFLTEADAVSGWVHKVTYSAGMDSDNPVQEGYIPVVLRTPLDQVQELLRPDEIGSRDVMSGDSFYIEDTLTPEELEVYTPEGWIFVDEIDPEDLQEYAYDNADKEVEEDYDTGLEEELVWLDEHVFNPFRNASVRQTGWGETVNTVLVHTCGRNSIEPECEGADGFNVLPTGKMPKTKKKSALMVHQGNVYKRMTTATNFKAPTEEMKSFFKKRTQDHINRVIKFMGMLKGFEGLSFSEVAERAKVHDEDKYSDADLIIPYIWVTEYHRVNNDEGSVSDELQEQYDLANKATGKHVEKNLHHPEAHSSTGAMTDLDLAEMVCDWAAMADELGEGSPRGWADKNVGSKWKFSTEQTDYIYAVIDWLEGKK